MRGRWTQRAWTPLTAAGWLLVIAGPLICHAAIVTGRFAAAAMVVSAVQVVVLAGLGLRAKRSVPRWLWLAAAATMLGVLLGRLAWPHRMAQPLIMATSGISHTAIYLSFLLLFAQSLRPGCSALVTDLARRIRGTLSPAMVRYTRTVTKAWCLFFTAQLLTSAILLAWAPPAVWSLYVNLLDLPLILTMFVTEYAVRRLRFRGETHASPAAAIRSFSARG